MTIHLTEREIECLLDRPIDCIEESYIDSEITDAASGDAVYMAAEELYSCIRTTKSLPDNPSELQSWILADMVEGSTWVASHSWDADAYNGVAARAVRVAESVAAKVAACIGCSVEAVLY